MLIRSALFFAALFNPFTIEFSLTELTNAFSLNNNGSSQLPNAISAITARSEQPIHTYSKIFDETRTTSIGASSLFQVGQTTEQSVKIPVDGKRWYQLNNATKGLDQLSDGDTATNVETGWGKVLEFYDSYYPLLDGEEMRIDSIRFFDGWGNNADKPMTLSVIDSRWQRRVIARFTGEQNFRWVGPDPAQPNNFKLAQPITDIRYLVITTSWGFPTEMQFFGAHTPGRTKGLARPPAVPLRSTFGINAHEWDFGNGHEALSEPKMKAMNHFTAVRHYLEWNRIEYQQGVLEFNPSTNGGWNYDAIYQRCKDDGIDVLIDIHSLPNWIANSYPAAERDMENVPAMYGLDRSQPASYREQAEFGFQLAARYGSTPVPDNLLKAVTTPVGPWPNAPVRTKRSAMNLVKYIECDNERDKWWKGRKAYQTAREYAANLSAFYDGHKNTMGAGVGVKNADQNMKVVIGGFAGANSDYLKGMVDWCKEFRGFNADGTVNICWDIINYHNYSGISGNQYGNSTRGAAPELTVVGSDAEKMVQTAHDICNGIPVWISELGYDVNQGSPFKAIAIGNKSILETQADWVLRSSLLYARKGVQKVFFYQSYDYDINNPIQFGSMGLIEPDTKPKPAAVYLNQVNKKFGEYVYKETIHSNPIVDRYEVNGNSMYMLVVPDETGRTANYNLDLGDTDSVAIYSPALGQDTLARRIVRATNGKVSLTASETPMFVTPLTPRNPEFEVLPVVTPVLSIRNPSLPSHAIQLFPNPTQDQVNIRVVNDDFKMISFRIVDVKGRVIQSMQFEKKQRQVSRQLDVSALPLGTYFCEIKQGGTSVTKSFVKTSN